MKTKFKLPNACDYRGASMGRRNVIPDDPKTDCKLRLVRLPFVDGCYDRWGAYWGSPANVYCATGDAGEIVAFVFVRADSRPEAKNKVRRELPNARFFN